MSWLIGAMKMSLARAKQTGLVFDCEAVAEGTKRLALATMRWKAGIERMNSPATVAALMSALNIVWLFGCISRPGLTYPKDQFPR